MCRSLDDLSRVFILPEPCQSRRCGIGSAGHTGAVGPDDGGHHIPEQSESLEILVDVVEEVEARGVRIEGANPPPPDCFSDPTLRIRYVHLATRMRTGDQTGEKCALVKHQIPEELQADPTDIRGGGSECSGLDLADPGRSVPVDVVSPVVMGQREIRRSHLTGEEELAVGVELPEFTTE